MKHRVHDRPLRSSDAPAALCLFPGQRDGLRKTEVGFQFSVLDEHPAPNYLTWFSDAFK